MDCEKGCAHKVLIVEDSKDIQALLAKILQLSGFEVVIADNGDHALKSLSNMEAFPCCIALDLMMPVVDGFEFREAQLKDARICDIPVIAMSGASHLLGNKARLKANRYFQKPIELKDFIQSVRELCKAS